MKSLTVVTKDTKVDGINVSTYYLVPDVIVSKYILISSLRPNKISLLRSKV